MNVSHSKYRFTACRSYYTIHTVLQYIWVFSFFGLDVQPLALLMDSVAAKDLACLLAGYCKLLVDPNMNVFRWGPRPKIRRIPLEEGKF